MLRLARKGKRRNGKGDRRRESDGTGQEEEKEEENTYTPSNTTKSLSFCITLLCHPPLSSGIRYTHRTNSVTKLNPNAPKNTLKFGLARRSAVAGLRAPWCERTRRKYSVQKKAKTSREKTCRQIPVSMMLVPVLWAESVLADAAMPPPMAVGGKRLDVVMFACLGGFIPWNNSAKKSEAMKM